MPTPQDGEIAAGGSCSGGSEGPTLFDSSALVTPCSGAAGLRTVPQATNGSVVVAHI